MATRRTWIWVLGAVLGVGLVAMLAVAGAGVYFVTSHIRSERSDPAEATRAFEAAPGPLHGRPALFEMDDSDQPRPVRPLPLLPNGPTASKELFLLAWKPEEARLVHVRLPFWMLRVGNHRMRISGNGPSFDLERLNLDVDELERIGPAIVMDFRGQDGVRVLVWTQ
jgi:hypothetical protein